MPKITVKAKITAGYHPGLNTNIIQGDEYVIEEEQFGDQLFDRPSPDWLAPWERPAETVIEQPAADTPTGGKKK
jgi:hypothetical protein